MAKLSLVLLSLAAVGCHHVSAKGVTVYGQEGMTIPSAIAATETSTATANPDLDWISNYDAYNTVTLTAPTLPTPVPSAFAVTVQNSASNVQGLGIQQRGDFMGFSIEMSVVQQVSE